MVLDNLQAAEDQAAKRPDLASDVDSTREAEASETENDLTQDPFAANFKNKVTGKKPFQSNRGWRGRLKSKMPLGFVLAFLVGGASLAGVAQNFFGFSYLENLIQDHNSLHTSQSRRFRFLRRYLLRNNSSHSDADIFGGAKTKYSKKLRSKLSKQGIEYDEIELSNGKKTKVLLYEDSSGSKRAVVGADADIGSVPDSYVRNKKLVAVESLDTAMSRPNFNRKFKTGTKAVDSHASGWWDTLSTFFHRRIKNNRNRFGDVDKNAKPEKIQDAAKKSGLKTEADATDSSRLNQEPEDDGNGGQTKEKPLSFEDGNDGNDSFRAGMSEEEATKAFKNRAQKFAAMGGTAGCMFMRAMGGINMAMAGIQVAQVLNYGSSFFEAIQKTKAGDGGSEYNYFMNKFSRPGDTYGFSSSGSLEKVRTNTASISSPATQSVFSKKDLSLSDPVAKRFNRESFSEMSILNATNSSAIAGLLSSAGIAGSSAAIFHGCNYFQAGMATAGLVLALFSFGSSSLVKGIFKAAVLQSAMVGVSAMISIMVPHIAKWLAMDLIKDAYGEDAAYAAKSAANIYFGGQHQASSGAAGTLEALKSNIAATKEIIAEDAKYDRATRSPLDPTSNHTFLGSLLRQVMSIRLSPSIISSIANMSGTLTSSLHSLIPAVGATNDEVALELATKTDCPSLSTFGVVGDAFCNKYTTTDLSTIDMDPYAVYESVGTDNFDGTDAEGNPIIAEDSDFSKYIVACTLRESQIGAVDANIQSFVSKATDTGNVALNSVVDGGLSMVPIVGDAIDLFESASAEKNFKWNSGKACVQDPSGTYNPDWNTKNKYFQRYSEDQRIMEAMGIIDKSAVTAFVEKHFQKHPIDHSFEGTIARYSGLAKTEVKQTLEIVAYINAVANYNPAGKFPALISSVPQLNLPSSDQHLSPQNFHIIPSIIYRNLRNRITLA